jgi:hypothetical protein
MTSKQTRRTALIQTAATTATGLAAALVSGQGVNQGNSRVNTMKENPRLYSFVGSNSGRWRVTSTKVITGECLPDIVGLNIVNGNAVDDGTNATWILQGVTSNERYVTREEKDTLLSKQQGLGRPDSNCGVLIPIRKSAGWWSLTQDERRNIFENESRHNAIGLQYLPAIARRLHHCRDLSELQPFDFLTWFEFAEEHAEQFDRLVDRLRESREWSFVDRELEFRFRRDETTRAE